MITNDALKATTALENKVTEDRTAGYDFDLYANNKKAESYTLLGNKSCSVSPAARWMFDRA